MLHDVSRSMCGAVLDNIAWKRRVTIYYTRIGASLIRGGYDIGDHCIVCMMSFQDKKIISSSAELRQVSSKEIHTC